MSKNHCVAEKGEDLPLNISRSSSCSWFYLTKTASLVNLLQGAGEGGWLRARQCQSGIGVPGPTRDKDKPQILSTMPLVLSICLFTCLTGL